MEEGLAGETTNTGKRVFKTWNASIKFLRLPLSGFFENETIGQSI
jgi:hypothetical protein